ncbi:molybdenum cofactor biosynthesis protein B [Ureibacillus massiliensis 4400831 = CIP 108448 = CCUG 49529]|uniref:Molybdenum cofactor biosynthesis protein B n=1 Tax=Ureibacillus massiliensis 4400831 = CIP 108448 = CCUG 49529 TaxID=1211035 RepID=A0A0A3JNN1_9BACL|nr:MogA/MoaB family molybdenum cofactor biosynthesis protein [Ureibacillus massiliensis]KGR88637.1 molybdenum cofactor biosynthesis protein B [Ureibacillus massiliensis 4400831 = CIP 108448 = CCUG 49529]
MNFHHHKNDMNKINIMVLTISDTRDKETDKSGQLIIDLLKNTNYRLSIYQIVRDEKEVIKNTIIEGCEDSKIDVIITNGGTGLSKRDVTFETLNEIYEKPILGYGELFRFLSYQEIGSAAMLSRACAGIVKNTVIFSTPGSTNAVKLAMEKLILPEIQHIVSEIRKD